MTSTGTRTTTTYESSGTGRMTVKTLLDILQDYPIDANVTITTGGDQRDGDWWKVKATYVNGRNV